MNPMTIPEFLLALPHGAQALLSILILGWIAGTVMLVWPAQHEDERNG